MTYRDSNPQLPFCWPIRRSVVQRTGMFETTWQVGVDLDWFLRVNDEDVRFEVLPQVVHRRRNRDDKIIGSDGPWGA